MSSSKNWKPLSKIELWNLSLFFKYYVTNYQKQSTSLSTENGVFLVFETTFKIEFAQSMTFSHIKYKKDLTYFDNLKPICSNK